jgi:hypothetical protein
VPQLTPKPKPSNAGWIAKAVVKGDGDVAVSSDAPDGTFPDVRPVEVAWYPNGRIKLTITGAAPAMISQAYLTGADRKVIIEIAPEERH